MNLSYFTFGFTITCSTICLKLNKISIYVKRVINTCHASLYLVQTAKAISTFFFPSQNPLIIYAVNPNNLESRKYVGA